jgi:hypothetical protein
MKNVGILSMQRIQNYGSFLQAYGLKEILKELDCNVQFVDYLPGKTLIPTREGKGYLRSLYKVLEVIKYKAPLKAKIDFIKYKKNYGANYFPYLGINNEKNYNPEVDVLVIGSDEVFNCVQSNTNVGFSPELFGVNNRAKKLISYAASFGNTTEDTIEQYGIKDKLSHWLRNFDAISVRDENSYSIIKSLTGLEPQYNLDPVLAYDFVGKCEQIPKSVDQKKYLLLYGYSGRFSKNECEEIRKFAKYKGLEIICIGGIQSCCDRFVSGSPFEVISYFQNAEYVITDTFHGTILSIITHSKFAVLIRTTGYSNSNKLCDLLNRLKINDRVISEIKDLQKLLEHEIDYRETDRVIADERKRTYEYLRNQIAS